MYGRPAGVVTTSSGHALARIPCGCSRCVPHAGQRFDVPVTIHSFPLPRPPDDYPVFKGNVGDQPVTLRVLNGEIEEKLSAIEDEAVALQALIDYAVDWGDQKAPPELGREALDQIEQQLEEGSPAIADEVISQCPYCGTDVKLTLSFISGLLEQESVLQDIHQIAMHYHWSQEAITALPRRRRKQYIKMINAALGMED